jgi:viroplasmin and RNaseH domain-containing protein
MKKKWYVMYIGRLPGVYDEWSECHAQVNRFRGSSYKGFQSKSEAEASYLKFTVLDVERNKNGLKYYLLFAFFFIAMGFLLYRKIL